MSSIREAAVSSFDETLAGIRKAQEMFVDTQDHYVSLVTFCSCEMKELYEKAPVAEARLPEMADYQPCCYTPLYDAMAFTLSIRNARNFDYSLVGASMAMAKDCSTRMNLIKKVHHFREQNMDGAMSKADVANSYAEMVNEAFDEVNKPFFAARLE